MDLELARTHARRADGVTAGHCTCLQGPVQRCGALSHAPFAAAVAALQLNFPPVIRLHARDRHEARGAFGCGAKTPDSPRRGDCAGKSDRK